MPIQTQLTRGAYDPDRRITVAQVENFINAIIDIVVEEVKDKPHPDG